MTISANATDAPAAAAQSDFAVTAALIKEIAAEARASGKPVTFDPDAPEPADPEAAETDAETPAEAGAEAAEDGAPAEQEKGDAEPETAPAVELDSAAIQTALALTDPAQRLEALAKALSVEPESLQLTPSQFKAARLERQRSQKTLLRAQALSEKLEKTYGDQVRARKAAAEGDLQPAIDLIEGVFGMGWNDLNRMVGDLLAGKPIADLEQKRELRELKKREAQREEEEKARNAEAESQQQVTNAKAWIRESIRADKLADPAFNRELEAAGMPTVVDLVFEEMRANYNKGLTDPIKALDRVKAKLFRQAKALQVAGVIPKALPPAKAPLTSKPRSTAQSGSAGNGRPMTDAELRRAVLAEAGLLRK